MRWTRSKPFGIIICTMTMTLVHLTLLVLIMILPPPFTYFHFFHVQTVIFPSNDENTRSRWLCLLECISSSIVIVCSALLCFFYSWPVVVWWKSNLISACIESDQIYMCAFFGLFLESIRFWWVSILGYRPLCMSLSCFFLKFLILMTIIFLIFSFVIINHFL